jgi:hypothetical protein
MANEMVIIGRQKITRRIFLYLRFILSLYNKGKGMSITVGVSLVSTDGAVESNGQNASRGTLPRQSAPMSTPTENLKTKFE